MNEILLPHAAATIDAKASQDNYNTLENFNSSAIFGSKDPKVEIPTTDNAVLEGVAHEKTEEKAADALKTPEEKAHEEAMSRRFAILARKEREVLRREKEINEKLERVARYEESKKSAKTKPLDWLKEGELDIDDLTNYLLNDGKPQEVSKETVKLQSEIDALRKMIEEKEINEAKAKEQAAVRDFKEGLKHYVESDKQKYELINRFDHLETVYNVIERHYQENQKLLSYQEAADLVENYLERDLDKLTEVEKLKSKYNSGAPSAPLKTNDVKVSPAPSQGPKTLTNRVEMPPRTDRRMSPSERLSEASRLLRWNE